MDTLRTAVWHQYGAALDTLESAVHSCPDSLWADRSQKHEYWYLVFHTLFFHDLYLSERLEGFTPPAPFTLSEVNPDGEMPPRVYTKSELLDYLEHGRRKLRASVAALTEEHAAHKKKFWTAERSELEWMLYNMRHVQHHSAQLNLMLRQSIDFGAKWIGTTAHLLEEKAIG
jgi:hypothetical protein